MASDVIGSVGNVAPAYAPEVPKNSPADSAGTKENGSIERVNPLKSADSTRADNDARSSQLNEEQLQSAVDKINEMMRQGQRSLSFSVDEESNQVVVTVKNTETDEVVRQIPNEETLKFARHIESMMGLIFNDKA